MAKGRDNIYIDNNSLSEESIDEDDLYDGGKNPKTRSKGIDRRKKDKGKGKEKQKGFNEKVLSILLTPILAYKSLPYRLLHQNQVVVRIGRGDGMLSVTKHDFMCL